MKYDYILSVCNEELNLSYSFPVELDRKMQDLPQNDIDFLQEVESKKGTLGLWLGDNEDLPLRAPTAPLAIARPWDPVVLCGSGFCRTSRNKGFANFRSALYDACALPAKQGESRSKVCAVSPLYYILFLTSVSVPFEINIDKSGRMLVRNPGCAPAFRDFLKALAGFLNLPGSVTLLRYFGKSKGEAEALLRRETDKLWEYLSAKALGHTYKPTAEKPSAVEEITAKQEREQEDPKQDRKQEVQATSVSYMWLGAEDTSAALTFAASLSKLLFSGRDVVVSSEGEGISIKGDHSIEEAKKFFQIVSFHIENE